MLMTIGFSTMFLADIVWAMAKVTGQYLLGGLSDAIYMSCYSWLLAAAREQLRGPPPATKIEASAVANTVIQGLPYVAMLVSFVVLVYFESDVTGKPTTVMTVIIFALTLLVMLRQGVILRDDALLRGTPRRRTRRGPLRVAHPERVRRHHDHRRRRAPALRIAVRRAHVLDASG